MFVKGRLLNSALLSLHSFIIPNRQPKVTMNEAVMSVWDLSSITRYYHVRCKGSQPDCPCINMLGIIGVKPLPDYFVGFFTAPDTERVTFICKVAHTQIEPKEQ